MKAIPAMAALVLAGCGQVVEERPPEAPAAYVVIASTSSGQGWEVLDDLDRKLPAADRKLIEVRGLVSGSSDKVMVRFGGDCASRAGFVAHVQAVAAAHGIDRAECTATLPSD